MNDAAWAAMAFVAGLTSAMGASAAPRPEPAPSSFTTNNYQLTARIPPGLFHCPYPPDWIGSDHGIVIYLVKPSGCDPASPTAGGAEATSLPRITLFYAYNAADIDLPGGVSGPPRTNAQWLRHQCPAPAAAILTGPNLLGAPAIECSHRTGAATHQSTGTLYRQAAMRPEAAEAPDSELWITLDTTPGRYPHDTAALDAIVASVRVCRSLDRPPQPHRPPCPPFVQW